MHAVKSVAGRTGFPGRLERRGSATDVRRQRCERFPLLSKTSLRDPCRNVKHGHGEGAREVLRRQDQEAQGGRDGEVIVPAVAEAGSSGIMRFPNGLRCGNLFLKHTASTTRRMLRLARTRSEIFTTYHYNITARRAKSHKFSDRSSLQSSPLAAQSTNHSLNHSSKTRAASV